MYLTCNHLFDNLINDLPVDLVSKYELELAKEKPDDQLLEDLKPRYEMYRLMLRDNGVFIFQKMLSAIKHTQRTDFIVEYSILA